MKGLILVAHPDDETIWMGGTILKYRDWDWTIISLCRKEDPDRKPKFMKVCNYYKAACVISDLDDKELKPLPINYIESKIRAIIPENSYDYIFTHGDNGEYGHMRHKEIHQAVKKLIKKKLIKCRKIFTFSYLLSKRNVPNTPNLKIPEPNKNSDKHIRLSEQIFKKKANLVKSMYGFPSKSFEVLSCNKTEAFKILT